MHRNHRMAAQITLVPAVQRTAKTLSVVRNDTVLGSPEPHLLASACVVVPMLNAARIWSTFNDGLRRQGLTPQQVLVIDSSSTDGTPDLARAEGYRVVTIARAEFNHGGTRQVAARLLRSAQVLVYLTQDAILENDDSIAQLLRPFEDPSVGATFGRQLPRIGAGPIESHARNFNYPPESSVRTLEMREALGFKAVFLSNSFAAYRASALAAVGGFPSNVIVSEETIVSSRLLLNGWKTVYVAEAKVRHSHLHSYQQEFCHYFDIGVVHAREPWLLHEFGRVDGEGMRFALSELHDLWPGHAYLVPSSLIRLLIKYVGYKLGRIENTLGPSISKRFSQQKQYWC